MKTQIKPILFNSWTLILHLHNIDITLKVFVYAEMSVDVTVV